MTARALIVAGLSYGDEGKGATVDALVRKHNSSLVVRYNGGAQAAHHVHDGWRSHCFSQYGAGAFAGASTYLSKYMLVDPGALLQETLHLVGPCQVRDVQSKLYIDREALVVTRFHKAANRLIEAHRVPSHGSTGMGIGETIEYANEFGEDALRVKDLQSETAIRRKLPMLQGRLLDKIQRLLAFGKPETDPEWEILTKNLHNNAVVGTYQSAEWLKKNTKIVSEDWWKKRLAAAEDETIVFEGAQGILLDQTFGFQPHTTWSNTTFDNAEALLGNGEFRGEVRRVGVTRSYMTRHGAGPLVTEQTELDVLSEGDDNTTGPWQGRFRSGGLDLVALRYAVDVAGGIHDLAVNHLDRLLVNKQAPVCLAYYEETPSQFFVTHDYSWYGPRTDICVGQFTGHERYVRQEGLTQALGKVRPIHEQAKISDQNEAIHYAKEIARYLNAQNIILGFGREHSDRRWMSLL